MRWACFMGIKCPMGGDVAQVYKIDGHWYCEKDRDRIERALKPVKVGKYNY